MSGVAENYVAANERLGQDVQKRWGRSASVRVQCLPIRIKGGSGRSVALIAFPRSEKPHAGNVEVVLYGSAFSPESAA